MSGTSLALKIGTLVLGLGAYLVLLKKVKGLKKHGLAGLIFILLTSLILSSGVFFLLMQFSGGEIISLLLYQIFVVVIGIIFVALTPFIIPWFKTHQFSVQLVFIISLLLFGYLFSNLIFTFLLESTIVMVWQLSLLWFLVPFMLNQTIIKLLEVPEKEYKEWYYPINQTIADPTDAEMENPVIISFEFLKNADSTHPTTFRAKAPVNMSLGRLFYFFINDYNSRHPEETIQYLNRAGQPCKWVFFKIKNKFLNLKQALDPDDSIYSCNITENDILLCKRMIININSEEDETDK